MIFFGASLQKSGYVFRVYFAFCGSAGEVNFFGIAHLHRRIIHLQKCQHANKCSALVAVHKRMISGDMKKIRRRHFPRKRAQITETHRGLRRGDGGFEQITIPHARHSPAVIDENIIVKLVSMIQIHKLRRVGTHILARARRTDSFSRHTLRCIAHAFLRFASSSEVWRARESPPIWPRTSDAPSVFFRIGIVCAIAREL